MVLAIHTRDPKETACTKVITRRGIAHLNRERITQGTGDQGCSTVGGSLAGGPGYTEGFLSSQADQLIWVHDSR